MVELVDGETRRVIVAGERLPGRAHRAAPTTSSCSSGVEPHLAWPLYVACVRRSSSELGCDAVVTVGATADAIPHTRIPLVVGSTADAELARRLALSAPTYQGITGLIGVLHVDAGAGRGADDLAAGRCAALPRPHGAPARRRGTRAATSPTCSASPIVVDLADDDERWAAQHDEVVADDDQLQSYVRMLEVDYDRRAEALARRAATTSPSRFEQYLRDQPDDDD